MSYKHSETAAIISDSSYDNLSTEEKRKYFFSVDEEPTHQVGDDGFCTSLLIGAATDSALLGGLLGGNFGGGIMGDLLNGGDL